MHRLARNKVQTILSMLVEGCSIRATARTVGCHKNTVADWAKIAGRVSYSYQYQNLRNLKCKRIQVDEIWSFIYAKEHNLTKMKKPHYGAGDIWTWIAIDPDTKLVPSFLIGERSVEEAITFLADLESRLKSRIQLTTDGYGAYLNAVEEVFGQKVDYAVLAKIFKKDEVELRQDIIAGNPDADHTSTSMIERQNLTLRMGQRRYTRHTNGFSKKLQNHALALALHFMHYNFIRIHHSLKITPAMAAGVTDKLHDWDWLIDMIEDAWPKPKRPKTYKKRSAT